MAFYIQSVHSKKYLDIKDNNDCKGAEVIIFDFTGGKNQQWKYKNGNIVSELNGLVLDIERGEESGKIIMWSKNGGDNQKWTFEDDFTIKSGLNFVLDVKDASKDNHTNLLAFSGHGGDNQKFRVVPVNDD
ncbi:uncharacterized protein LOC110835784 [Zootermopsis nevadensis]|uniref:Alpha-L-arabinofuranosidase n=2 Tax=Zootermopsis nevadensis TaxID=136037 RepID=A0A067QST1_ZOONE|nr:uncharacterized protein LOC110835784 [Zootermopsis nevadensis]XP_021932049.1 uncharacterized protein LOC110835784 [Zootermopsis nevadensis]KDR12920.1 Alpha-L-arabinofuranosidase [Zootermopsis nevadensis]